MQAIRTAALVAAIALVTAAPARASPDDTMQQQTNELVIGSPQSEFVASQMSLVATTQLASLYSSTATSAPVAGETDIAGVTSLDISHGFRLLAASRASPIVTSIHDANWKMRSSARMSTTPTITRSTMKFAAHAAMTIASAANLDGTTRSSGTAAAGGASHPAYWGG